jgi:hypothetical protein
MPDGSRLDVLAVHADGTLSLCECKLARNAGIRREVIGQILEYASLVSSMSFSDFCARVDARLEKPLVEAMEAKTGDEWDREAWKDEVTSCLSEGAFRLVIAVDAIAPTLKETVSFLNFHTDFAVLAVELHHARLGDFEILAPQVFGDEQARRKLSSPPRAPTVEDPDTVVVGAKHALEDYDRLGTYICQPERSFRSGTKYLGFYYRRRIDPRFPKVDAFRRNIVFSRENAAQLRASADPDDARVAEVIEKDLEVPSEQREAGKPYQVVLLDQDAGFTLDHAIRHEGGAAWLQGQRYTRSDALRTEPDTTEELQARGG